MYGFEYSVRAIQVAVVLNACPYLHVFCADRRISVDKSPAEEVRPTADV
jgi:hypothetical protein